MNDTLKIRRVVLAIALAGAIGCNGVLDVSDPTLVRDPDIANARGANGRRLYASFAFNSRFPGIANNVAYITDEWTYDTPANATPDLNSLLDQRNSIEYEAFGRETHLSVLDQIFLQTSFAIPAVRAYTPDSLQGDFLAQLYGIRGYVVLQMAEDLCPGFSINDVVDGAAAYGGPVTTHSAFAYASILLDSALKYMHDSTRFVTLIRVAKGRVLLNQGKYPEAAAAVAPVMTTAMYTTEPGERLAMFPSWCNGCRLTGVGDHEGTNGLPFVSAGDPRIPVQVLGPRNTNSNDTLYVTTLGSGDTDVTTITSGIEARLIEAEAALNNDDPSWKSILDALRATLGLGPLTDPGTANGRIDLLYSERAFWLYMSGRRLGDMRRLIRNYGRDPDAVFPTGAYLGGNGGRYGTATSIPFIFADEQRYNPNLTSGCTSR